jgi:hypothetical protein
MEYNIYCDESCHLEKDPHKAMVLGAIWCASKARQEIFDAIKGIKVKHRLKPDFEIKWHKVSLTKLAFYKEIINYFFDSTKLHFRALIVADKKELNYEAYGHTHDEFYYKMYFDMLKIIIRPKDTYNIYLDIKDTTGIDKVNKLHEVICKAHYDFSKSIVKKIQEVRSDEVSILQITDLMIGALSYYYRDLHSNMAKVELVDLIQQRSGYSFMNSTLPSESKFNLFIWHTGYLRHGNY